MRFEVNVSEAMAKVTHTGIIEADGGRVALEARARDALQSTVINSEGVIRARGLVQRNGRIVLDGGDSGRVAVSGTVDVSNPDAAGRGGEAHILGADVLLAGTARVDATGGAAGGSILIGGDRAGASPEIRRASSTGIDAGAIVDASAIVKGDGGSVVIWGDDAMRFDGFIAARGGAAGGAGGFVETSSRGSLAFPGGGGCAGLRRRGGRYVVDRSGGDSRGL
jgi:hypothetical protein